MADVFISYSQGDRDWVKGLASCLEAEGFSIWWDPNILPGSRFRKIVKTELAGAKAVIVVWSHLSVESDWVIGEADEGRSMDKLIPILKEAVRPPTEFRTIQTADLSQWRGRKEHPEFRRVVAAVRFSLEDGQTPPLPPQVLAEPAGAKPFVPRPDEAAGGKRADVLSSAWDRWRNSSPTSKALGVGALTALLGIGLIIVVFAAWSIIASHSSESVTSATPTATPSLPGNSLADLPTPKTSAPADVPATTPTPPIQVTHSGEFTDCSGCPRMVWIPSGSFTMGSPPGEHGRGSDEEPQHPVAINYALAVGKYDVTRDEYALFATETNRPDQPACETFHNSSNVPNASWRDPHFPQSGSDPVVCVSWGDAMAYTQWLSSKSGHHYRLLSESEFEYAARAGTTTAYYWGDAVGSNQANCDGCGSRWSNTQTSPAGSFRPNRFGLYDMLGNAAQWTLDCYHPNYLGAPTDGAAWQSDNCTERVARGGNWFLSPSIIRAASREKYKIDYRYNTRGFRVARTD
jgi:formylglycine-generating enzyme required for sulfatase activity